MARYYDAIYSQIVDYELEFKHIQSLIKKHFRGKPESVLDVACGTGNYTFLFAKYGHKATGIDISPEMIRAAKQKQARKNSQNPRFFLMDMTQIEKLSDKYDVICVLFGGFGYLATDAEIKKFFKGVSEHLTGNGLLIFEFWQTSAVSPEAKTRVGWKSWEKIDTREKEILRLNRNKYDSRQRALKIVFDFFVLDSNREKLLDAFSETHVLRTYTPRKMQETLKVNSLIPVGFYDGDLTDRLKPPESSTFRVLGAARVKERV